MAGHMGDKLRTMQNIEIIKTDLENELLYLKGSIPGSKNSEVIVKGSVKNINKLTIDEKIKAAEQAKKTPDKIINKSAFVCLVDFSENGVGYSIPNR